MHQLWGELFASRFKLEGNLNNIRVRSFILTGAPAKLLSRIGFPLRGNRHGSAGLQLVCKLCSRGVLPIEDRLLGEPACAREVAL